MNLKSSQIIAHVNDAKILSSCSNRELARIIPYITEDKFNKESVIFREGQPCDNFYVIIKGSVRLEENGRVVDELVNQSFGEECIDSGNIYLSTAIANEHSIALCIPKEYIVTAAKQNAKLKNDMFSSLLEHHTQRKRIEEKIEKPLKVEVSPPVIAEQPAIQKPKSQISKIIGWLLTILVPVVILVWGDELFGKYLCEEGAHEMEWRVKIFITVFSATVIMWVFRLTHEFIPSLLAVLVIVILSIAPAKTALSGFTSGSFFMAMSIFGLAAVLVTSGLTYRLVVNLLRIVPQSQFWYTITIFMTGIFLTPLLPAANGRISLASPLLIDMVDSLGYKRGGKAATRLSVATFSGFTLFSSIFLSSKSIHFVIFGLLPEQVKEQFNWGFWLYASLAAGGVLFVGYIIFVWILYRNNEIPKLSKDQIRAQCKMLGKMTSHEWAALGGVLLFLVGIASSSIHKIPLPWIGLIVLYTVLALQFLSKKEFKQSIDWTFLIFLGTLIGLVKSMETIGLDKILGNHFAWLGEYASSNIWLFVLYLSISIFLLRFFIPNNATVAILASVLLPIAQSVGINPWVVGFIILIMSDAWVMPYQCTYYLLFDELVGSKKIFNKKEFLKFNALTLLFRLGAVYASVFYWQRLGILSDV